MARVTVAHAQTPERRVRVYHRMGICECASRSDLDPSTTKHRLPSQDAVLRPMGWNDDGAVSTRAAGALPYSMLTNAQPPKRGFSQKLMRLAKSRDNRPCHKIAFRRRKGPAASSSASASAERDPYQANLRSEVAAFHRHDPVEADNDGRHSRSSVRSAVYSAHFFR